MSCIVYVFCTCIFGVGNNENHLLFIGQHWITGWHISLAVNPYFNAENNWVVSLSMLFKSIYSNIAQKY